jgi:hypothetical protein
MVKGWSREFDEPIDLPRGRQLVTLQDTGNYITKLPKAEHRARMAGRDGSLDARRNPGRADNARADRRAAGVPPQRSARVQSQSQGDPLGKAEAEEGSVKKQEPRPMWDLVERGLEER